MIGKGIFEIEVNGEKVGFKFGMLASAHTEKISGMGIFEVFKEMGEGKMLPVLHYFYGGAVAYALSKGHKEPNIDQVSDWIDVIGFSEAIRIYTESIQTYLPKNGQAPTNGAKELVSNV